MTSLRSSSERDAFDNIREGMDANQDHGAMAPPKMALSLPAMNSDVVGSPAWADFSGDAAEEGQALGEEEELAANAGTAHEENTEAQRQDIEEVDGRRHSNNGHNDSEESAAKADVENEETQQVMEKVP